MSTSNPKLKMLPDGETFACPVSAALCREIAKEWITKWWYKPVELTARDELFSRCEKHSGNFALTKFTEVFEDYLTGAGLVVNPFPSDPRDIFEQSDWKALTLDWSSVSRDMQDVWRTVASMHDWLQERGSNERAVEWKRPVQPAEPARPAEPASSTRRHNSGSF